MELLSILDWIDDILFIYFLTEVAYLLFLGTVPKSIIVPCRQNKRFRYAVLIPEGFSFPQQTYDTLFYKVFKYTSWQQEIKNISNEDFDEALILGPFVQVSPNLLETLNEGNNCGFQVMQLHTVLSDNSTYSLRRRARKEELRNGFLKSGCCGRGFSSAMDRLNFVIPLKWTQEHLRKENANLELLFTAHKMFIKYVSGPFIVADSFPEHCSHRSFGKSVRRLFRYLPQRDTQEIERNIRCLFPSHKKIVYLLVIIALALSFFRFWWAMKWWLLVYVTFFAYSLAMPDYVMEPHKQRKYSICRIWKDLRSKKSSKDLA